MSHPEVAPRLELRALRKRFGATQAVKGVDLALFAGEIHGLVGANGAGKSTLVKMISGLVEPDQGEILLDGRPLPSGDTGRALRAGIACIYQDDQLVPDLSVLDNLMLGRYQGSWYRPLPRSRARRDMHSRSVELGFDLDLDAPVSSLSPIKRKEIEIVRAITAEARVLLLDEPTAALPHSDAERLMEAARRARDSGAAVVFISHILEEILQLATRVTVLRNGESVASMSSAQLTRGQLVELMFGQSSEAIQSSRPTGSLGVRLLKVRGISRHGVYQDVELDVFAGEVVVLTGLAGSGRSSILRAIAGGERPQRGTIEYAQRNDHKRSSVGYVPQERVRQGLFGQRPVRENITCGALSQISTGGLLRSGRERLLVESQIELVDITPPDPESPVLALSGGNQQKAMLARWFFAGSELLVLDEPTAGVDIQARTEIYNLIRQRVDRGAAVLVASSDIEEVLAIADRVLVVDRGSVTREILAADLSREALLAAIGAAE